MKINNKYFGSAIVILGLLILASLWLSTGDVLPYSVSNYTSFEGFENDVTKNVDGEKEKGEEEKKDSL